LGSATFAGALAATVAGTFAGLFAATFAGGFAATFSGLFPWGFAAAFSGAFAWDFAAAFSGAFTWGFAVAFWGVTVAFFAAAALSCFGSGLADLFFVAFVCLACGFIGTVFFESDFLLGLGALVFDFGLVLVAATCTDFSFSADIFAFDFPGFSSGVFFADLLAVRSVFREAEVLD
jgi:hypothetical protein